MGSAHLPITPILVTKIDLNLVCRPADCREALWFEDSVQSLSHFGLS
jgi:hypothetical protein